MHIPVQILVIDYICLYPDFQPKNVLIMYLISIHFINCVYSILAFYAKLRFGKILFLNILIYLPEPSGILDTNFLQLWTSTAPCVARHEIFCNFSKN